MNTYGFDMMLTLSYKAERDVDLWTLWQSQLIRPDKNESDHWKRTAPSRAKAPVDSVCHVFFGEMEFIAVPVVLVAYVGNLV